MTQKFSVTTQVRCVTAERLAHPDWLGTASSHGEWKLFCQFKGETQYLQMLYNFHCVQCSFLLGSAIRIKSSKQSKTLIPFLRNGSSVFSSHLVIVSRARKQPKVNQLYWYCTPWKEFSVPRNDRDVEICIDFIIETYISIQRLG